MTKQFRTRPVMLSERELAQTLTFVSMVKGSPAEEESWRAMEALVQKHDPVGVASRNCLARRWDGAQSLKDQQAVIKDLRLGHCRRAVYPLDVGDHLERLRADAERERNAAYGRSTLAFVLLGGYSLLFWCFVQRSTSPTVSQPRHDPSEIPQQAEGVAYTYLPAPACQPLAYFVVTAPASQPRTAPQNDTATGADVQHGVATPSQQAAWVTPGLLLGVVFLLIVTRVALGLGRSAAEHFSVARALADRRRDIEAVEVAIAMESGERRAKLEDKLIDRLLRPSSLER